MNILWEALLIFTLRVMGITVSTVATLMTVQGRRAPAMAAGFTSALLYVVAIGKVVTDLNNVWNVLAYCTGFAVGTWVGILGEQRLALGYADVRFISPHKGAALAEALRQEGFGVTEMVGQGREQAVGIIEALIPRKNVDTMLKIARTVDAEAIVTITDARSVQRGYWPAGKGGQRHLY